MADTAPRDPLDYMPALGGLNRAAPSGDEPRLGGELALAHLLEAAQNPDPVIRQRAAEALGELGQAPGMREQAINRLLLLLTDPSADLRAQAARALGRARSVEAVTPLLNLLQDISDKVRWNAAEALGRIGHVGAVESLLASLKDRDQVVREHAAEALGGIGQVLPPGDLRDSIPPALLDTLRLTASMFYQRLSNVISHALVQMGDVAVPTLLDTLQAASGQVSESAAAMLAAHLINGRGSEKRGEIISGLLGAAASHDPLLARAAIRALGTAAHALQVIDAADAQRAAEGLISLYNTASVSVPPTENTKVDLRESYSRRFRFATVIPAVPQRDLTFIRPDLIMALGRFGIEHRDLALDVIPLLIHALYDDDPAMRRTALDALTHLAERHTDTVHAAIPALADRLNDDHGRPFTREPRISDAAATLLRRLGTADALAALERAGRG